MYSKTHRRLSLLFVQNKVIDQLANDLLQRKRDTRGMVIADLESKKIQLKLHKDGYLYLPLIEAGREIGGIAFFAKPTYSRI